MKQQRGRIQSTEHRNKNKEKKQNKTKQNQDIFSIPFSDSLKDPCIEKLILLYQTKEPLYINKQILLFFFYYQKKRKVIICVCYHHYLRPRYISNIYDNKFR